MALGLAVLVAGAGALAAWLPGALRARLPALVEARWGIALTVDEVRVHWPQLALGLESVRLERPAGRLERVTVRLDPLGPLAGRPVLGELRLEGGSLDGTAAQALGARRLGAGEVAALAVRGVRVQIRGEALEVDDLSLRPEPGGALALAARGRLAGGRLSAQGRILPWASGMEAELELRAAALPAAAVAAFAPGPVGVEGGQVDARGTLHIQGAGHEARWKGRVEVADLVLGGLELTGAWWGRARLTPMDGRLEARLGPAGEAILERVLLRLPQGARLRLEDGDWRGSARLAAGPEGIVARSAAGDLRAARGRWVAPGAGQARLEGLTAWGLERGPSGGLAAGQVRIGRLAYRGGGFTLEGGPLELAGPRLAPDGSWRMASLDAAGLRHRPGAAPGLVTAADRVQAEGLVLDATGLGIASVRLTGLSRSAEGLPTSLRLASAALVDLRRAPGGALVVERAWLEGLDGLLALGRVPAARQLLPPVPAAGARVGLARLGGDSRLALVDPGQPGRPRLALEALQASLAGVTLDGLDVRGRFEGGAVLDPGGSVALSGVLGAGDALRASGRVEGLAYRPLAARLLPLQGEGTVAAQGSLREGDPATAALELRLRGLAPDPARLPAGPALFALLADAGGMVRLPLEHSGASLRDPATWAELLGRAAAAAVRAAYGSLGADREAVARLRSEGRLPLGRLPGPEGSGRLAGLAGRLLDRPRAAVELCGGAPESRRALREALEGLGLTAARIVRCPDPGAGGGPLEVALVPCRAPGVGCGAGPAP